MRKFLLPLLLACTLINCDEPVPVTTDEPRDQLLDSADHLNELFWSARKNNLGLASVYAGNELALSTTLDYDKGIADGKANTGYVKYYQGDYPAALELYLSALELRKTFNDSSGIANCCYMIGKIHRMMRSYDKALEYANQGLAMHRKLNQYGEISSDLNGIGNIYSEMNRYDTAMTYYQQRVSLERSRGDSLGVASALADIGAAYTAEGDAETGLRYHLEALSKLHAASNDTDSWYLLKFKAGVLNDVAGDYALQNDYGQAITTAEEGLALAKSVYARKEKRLAYKTLAELYGLMGREDVQLQYLEQFIALNDSLLNEEGQAKVADAEVKYEVAAKETKIAKLDAANTQLELEARRTAEERQLILVGVVIFLLLAGTIGYVWYSRSRMRHKQAEFRSMIEGEENERKRIAMELHDGLGQLLSSARLNVSGLEDSVKKEDDPILQNSLSLIDEACVEVRNVSHNLMPAALIRNGLVSAIREMAGKISQSGKVEVEFEHELFKAKLSDAEEIAVYRIIQEAVNNALKYSKANTISISLSGTSHVHASIKDTGIGMPASPGTGPGIGWKNIRARVDMLNGKLAVSSTPGSGTSISFTIIPKQVVS